MIFENWWNECINLETKLSFIRHVFTLGLVACLLFLIIDAVTSGEYLMFQRSGAILGVSAVIVEFRIQQITGRLSITSDDLKYLKCTSIYQEKFSETNYCKSLKMRAHLTLFFGTLIWAFGDLPFK